MGFKNIVGGVVAPPPKELMVSTSDTEQRRDQLRFDTLLRENQRRSDSARLPSMTLGPKETLLKSDRTTVVVQFLSTGVRSFRVPTNVTTMRMEAWGSGGAGGGTLTGAVGGGGGGKGGSYARRNAQPVTSGSLLNVYVSPGSTANGDASYVAIANGQAIYSVPERTISITPKYNELFGWAALVLEQQGASLPVFVGSSSSGGVTTPSSRPITGVGGVVGDLAISVYGGTLSGQNDIDDAEPIYLAAGWTQTFRNSAISVWHKIVTASDSATPTAPITNGTSYLLVYRNVKAPIIGSSGQTAPGVAIVGDVPLIPLTSEFTSGQYSSNANFIMAYVFGGGGSLVSATPLASTPTYPAGVQERARSSSLNQLFLYNYGTFGGDETATQSTSTGTIFLQAAGGVGGGNGTGLAGGTGGTTVNGTNIGDVIFTGGNGANGTAIAGGAGGGGAGSTGSATGQTGAPQGGGNGGIPGAIGGASASGNPFGGGGGGAAIGANRGAGGQGLVRLTFTI